MSAATARNNYEYLDILDRAWSQSGAERPVGGVVCDIGCASFWYAQTLQTFFRARQLIGVEVEGYRLFKDGRTRIDYASGHLAGIDNASFVVADYRECTLQADTITAWFPFVTATAILAWRLPLSLLAPESIFERVYHNLNADGRFVMVNHGSAEALRAGELCESVGLSRRFTWSDLGVLSGHRAQPTVLSCWSRGVK